MAPVVTWEIELEPEVEQWMLGLDHAAFPQVQAVIDRLSEQGSGLRMPHSRSLGDGLFELRFFCEGVARRVTYWFAPQRRIVLLTTFSKTRNNERREVTRAKTVMQRCMSIHSEGR